MVFRPISNNKSNAGKRMAMQQQNSGLSGANAQTAVPQTATGGQALNPYKTGQSMQGTASYAQGGQVTPPPPPGHQPQPQFDPKLIQALAQAVASTPVFNKQAQQMGAMQTPPGQNPVPQQVQQQPQQAPQQAPQQQPQAPAQQAPQGNQPMYGGYAKGGEVKDTKEVPRPEFAKGGDVKSSMHSASLKDVIKALASHPGLGGQGMGNGNAPMTGPNMKEGGAVASGDPDAMKKPSHLKSEATSHGTGLLHMNADVQSYADGGDVADGGSDEVDATGVDQSLPPPNSAGFNAKNNPTQPQSPADGGILKMASGGAPTDTGSEGGAMEDDSVVGYGPDGTPIIQNPDGTEQYGDINQELDRPESAGTLGTGQTPATGVSANASNSVAQAAPENAMAKGGEEGGPPPGSLSKEVADDIPAKLSEGEFVFSADAVRYYGLQFLTGLMDHARQELAQMNTDGSIRHPGDDKNPDEAGGQFMQDAKPNMNAYGPDQGGDQDNEPQPKGLLKQAGMRQGGSVATCMATGGGISEEEFAKGGQVVGKENPFGRDNMVSAHPKGGDVLQDYATGGIVSSGMRSLTPKTDETKIPGLKLPKLSTSGAPKGPQASSYGIKEKLPKMKRGGLLKERADKDITQSYVGA